MIFMSFMIRRNWEKLNNDLWKTVEKSVTAPADMYIELLRFRLLEIEIDELTKAENVEALNNGEVARERFRGLPTPSSEADCVLFLMGYYEVLQRFNTEIGDRYRKKLSEWLTEHNLRYRITKNCELELTIPGLLATEYEFMKQSLEVNAERAEALQDLEKILSKLSDEDELRNCIRTASNLLEGVVIDRSTVHARTLTEALPGCQGVFPHNSLENCVKNIYKFCCDYPNIRHPGNPANRIRPLKKDDALLIITLTLALGTFISDNDASEAILAGSF